ncbi:MAG: hypothetical protein ABI380_15460 [Edaphobacter sp.]
MTLCECARNIIESYDNLCARHKSEYLNFEKIVPAGSPDHLSASKWIGHRLRVEIEHPSLYAELKKQEVPAREAERVEHIEKMRAGLVAAVLAMDHMLGANWFRADPDDIAAMQACLDGLDAHQMLISANVSPPPKRILNFITQRVKLDGYLGDSITNVCGCAEVIEDGHQLCYFHRQHYFAYRQKANPATMLRVQQWSQRRKSPINVWATKGGAR